MKRRKVSLGDVEPCPVEERVWFAPSSDREARTLRNLLDRREAENATRLAQNSDPVVAAIARQHLALRRSVLGKICGNVNCLQGISQAAGHRGRPRLYCSRACQSAAAMRAMRNEHDRNRVERLRHFDSPTRVFAGFAGRRRHRPKQNPLAGIDSIATTALRVQLHADAVSGSTTAAERVAAFLDGGWTPEHRAALARAPSLREQAEEARWRASPDFR